VTSLKDADADQLKLPLRASLVVPGFASASKNEKWPPSRMQMQTQAKLPLILLSAFWLDLEMVGFYH